MGQPHFSRLRDIYLPEIVYQDRLRQRFRPYYSRLLAWTPPHGVKVPVCMANLEQQDEQSLLVALYLSIGQRT